MSECISAHALACRREKWAERRGQSKATAAVASTAAGRRDKRGSPVGPQAIDMAWVLACQSVGARAAPCVFANAINDIFGTVAALAPFEVRP